MLTGPVLHPQILAALAGAGHGSAVLVTDANYPATTSRGRNAALVHLNLEPGVVDAVTIVSAVARSVPVEAVFVMAPEPAGPYAMAEDPPVWQEFRAALSDSGASTELQPVARQDFYELGAGPQVALTIVSGETRLYGNCLLRVGVRQDAEATPWR